MISKTPIYITCSRAAVLSRLQQNQNDRFPPYTSEVPRGAGYCQIQVTGMTEGIFGFEIFRLRIFGG